jgi:hypothetical protein
MSIEAERVLPTGARGIGQEHARATGALPFVSDLPRTRDMKPHAPGDMTTT